MAVITNSQTFNADASGTIIQGLQNSFHAAMDSVLLGLGRDITIHLPPTKSACPNTTDCVFNSTYRRYVGTDGKICPTCKGQGYLIEPLQTVYTANIRWTNEPFNESTRGIEEQHVVGRITQNFVRTKTVASALDHIKQSVGATIDGVDVELYQEPRQTGFGLSSLLYTVAWWKAANR